MASDAGPDHDRLEGVEGGSGQGGVVLAVVDYAQCEGSDTRRSGESIDVYPESCEGGLEAGDGRWQPVVGVLHLLMVEARDIGPWLASPVPVTDRPRADNRDVIW